VQLSAASFERVTASSANFTVVTAPAAIFTEVTASAASFADVTEPSAGAVSQVARPFASEVSTFPAPGTPPEILT